MPLPPFIQKQLDKYEVEFSVADFEATEQTLNPGAVAAKLVLLEDSEGKLQVLIPSNSILDLSRLCEDIGRNLTAVPLPRLQKFNNRHGLDHNAAISQLKGDPCFIEKSLFDASELFLESGVNGTYIKVSQQEFRKTLNDIDIGQFCEPIENYVNIANAEDDQEKIQNAINQFTLLRIKQRLDQTLDLPPLPNTAIGIIGLRSDENATTEQLASIVETDPSLAAQVISWASSPYYAAPGSVSSVKDAVIRVLGFDLVINLSLGLALSKNLTMPADRPQDHAPYWQQAVYYAIAVESLVKAMPPKLRPSIGFAYLSGLLNNFGTLILAHIFPPHYCLVNRYIEANPHVPETAIEQYLLGISNEQIAAWLLQNWQLPEEISIAIRWQHSPSYNGEHSAYPNIMFIAQQILKKHGIGHGPSQEIPDELYERCGLTAETALEALDKVICDSDDLVALASALNK